MAEKEAKSAASEIEIRVNPVRDGGFGWVVVAAAFVIQFIVLGLQNNVGIVFAALLDEFKKSKSETAWVGSIALGLMFMCGPFTSVLCEQLGCRVVGVLGGLLGVLGLFLTSFVKEIYKLYITFGLLWGIGASFCYFPTLRILPCWFNRHLSSANGIVTAGSGVGTIAMGPIMQLAITQLGWFNAARVFGGTLVLVSFVAFFYRVPPQPEKVKEAEGEEVKEKKPLLDWRVLQNKAYVIWIIALGVFMLGYWTPFVHLPRHAEEIGVSKAQASILVGIMSAGSTIGRLFFGKIADHPRVNRLYLYQVAMLSIGIADTLLPLVQNFFGLAVYMVTFGVFEGCYIVLMPVITGDIVGLDKLSAGIGVMFGFMSILVFIGPPLSGWMYDVAGGYDVAFYVAGACSVSSTIILFLVPLAMIKYDGSRNRSETAGSADSRKPLIGLSDTSSNSSEGGFRSDKTISTIEIEVTSPTESARRVIPSHVQRSNPISRQSWRGSQMSYIDMYMDMPKRTSLRQAIAAQSMADLTNLVVQRTTTV